MYINPINRWEEESEIVDFIQKNPFATLVSTVSGRHWATHLPLILSQNQNGDSILSGHVAKANLQWKQLDGEVMVIFQGPNAYISSSWYNHENVPTWNYLAVHAYCAIRIIEGEELLDHLKTLVDAFEDGRPNKVSVEGMSKKYLDGQLKGIIGLELTIKEIHASAKLSQNRDEINYKNIVEQLQSSPFESEKVLAEEMKKRMK